MSRMRIALLGVAGVIPIVLALWIAGFDVAYQLGHYVVSDDAVVTGDLAQAAAPAAGQVVDLLVSVGDTVEQGQALASVSAGPTSGGQASVAQRLLAKVRAPSSGTIVALSASRGQTVASGETLALIGDLGGLWAVADVDEASFRSVRQGERAEVYLPALDATYQGRVAEVMAAPSVAESAASRSANAATRPAPQFPVRVEFDYGEARVLPGMTATVRIFIKE